MVAFFPFGWYRHKHCKNIDTKPLLPTPPFASTEVVPLHMSFLTPLLFCTAMKVSGVLQTQQFFCSPSPTTFMSSFRLDLGFLPERAVYGVWLEIDEVERFKHS